MHSPNHNVLQTTELIEIVPVQSSDGRLWTPVCGAETIDLLKHSNIGKEAIDRLQYESANVLGRCLPPGDPRPGRTTGLVVGHVQSGKTLSFTTVATLARDNGFQLVIIIGGTAVHLLEQSTDRLERDLRLIVRRDRQWRHFESQSLTPATYDKIRDALADWRDPDVPVSRRKTVLLTVMKNHTHLQKVRDALSKVNLTGVATLVIDDEADQASLNNRVRKEEFSRTYERLLALRDVLPRHSFLQYTATPQAPLLITIIDALSPDFVELLTPGAEYVGGKDFFGDSSSKCVRTIPNAEISSPGNTVMDTPPSLIEAMQIFFLGVAAGVVRQAAGLPDPENRSMMVHPSQERSGHDEYYDWVRSIREQWKSILDPAINLRDDRAELLREFEKAYRDLKETVGEDLPLFELVQQKLLYAIRSTQIEKLNAATGSTPIINFKSDYSFILVGGPAMDRGFTVEGLTVTYMPRSIGVGHADTIQQRARFLGYKRSYLGYCRVYLPGDARRAYAAYVKHEEHVHEALAAHKRTGRSLKEWKRNFFLDSRLKPTRRSVLKLDYTRTAFGTGWFEVAAPHTSLEAIAGNRSVIESFLQPLSLHEADGHRKRTDMQCHNVAREVPLRTALELLLAQFVIAAPDDSQVFTGLRLIIEYHLDKHPEATCTVYHMSKGKERQRSVDDAGEIKNLFQGSNPSDPARDDENIIYPGDRAIRAPDGITIQIHNLRITGTSDGPLINVPTLAVWLPSELSQAVVTQDQSVLP